MVLLVPLVLLDLRVQLETQDNRDSPDQPANQESRDTPEVRENLASQVLLVHLAKLEPQDIRVLRDSLELQAFKDGLDHLGHKVNLVRKVQLDLPVLQGKVVSYFTC